MLEEPQHSVGHTLQHVAPHAENDRVYLLVITEGGKNDMSAGQVKSRLRLRDSHGPAVVDEHG